MRGRIREYLATPGLARGLRLDAFPQFGCYVYRSDRLYLLIRAWQDPPAHTAHLHNDQLGVVLWIDGAEEIGDPGSYLYTPIPDERLRYRSVHAHDTPWPGSAGEPADLDRGLFTVGDPVAARVLMVEPDEFRGAYEAKGIVVERRVRILDDRVVIEDWPNDARGKPSPPPRSPGYGIRKVK